MTAEEFVTDKSGFVDPEKVEAVELYGLEKAKEMWKDKAPDWETRTHLQKRAFLKYLIWTHGVDK